MGNGASGGARQQGPRNYKAPTPAPRGTSSMSVTRGPYSDQARVAAVDGLVRANPALRSALQDHYAGGGLPLSVASVAGRLDPTRDGGVNPTPSAAARAKAQQIMGELSALSQWSLAHGAGGVPLNPDDTITLYHGSHGRDAKQGVRSLSSGTYREGMSFTASQGYATRISSAYSQRGEQQYTVRADVPLSAITVYDGLFAGVSSYQHAAYEQEYVLGTGTPLRRVQVVS